MKKVLLVFSLSLFLSGCNLIDEYYVYDEIFITKLKKDLDYEKIKNDEVKNFTLDYLSKVSSNTKIRFKLILSPKINLVVIKSYKFSNELKNELLERGLSVQESESRTYDTCDHINDRNWICKGFDGYGSGYEMREGDLYKDGQKLLKKYSINF